MTPIASRFLECMDSCRSAGVHPRPCDQRRGLEAKPRLRCGWVASGQRLSLPGRAELEGDSIDIRGVCKDRNESRCSLQLLHARLQELVQHVIEERKAQASFSQVFCTPVSQPLPSPVQDNVSVVVLHIMPQAGPRSISHFSTKSFSNRQPRSRTCQHCWSGKTSNLSLSLSGRLICSQPVPRALEDKKRACVAVPL